MSLTESSQLFGSGGASVAAGPVKAEAVIPSPEGFYPPDYEGEGGIAKTVIAVIGAILLALVLLGGTFTLAMLVGIVVIVALLIILPP